MRSSIYVRRGSSLVEFVLASFVFFITVFGIMQLGLAVWRYNFVANLAKEGARRAVVCGASSGLASTDCNILSYVQARSNGLLTICNTCVTTTPTTISSLVAGDTVTVRVDASFTPLTALIPHAALTFSSSATMVVAR